MASITSTRRTSIELLGDAVHRNRSFSIDGVLERLFTLSFRDLVYPMIWEDPRVDLQALEIRPDSRIVTIASGGCNVLNYLTADPERIYAVDLNRAHVALNKLKITALLQLADHARFYAMFGSADDRRNVELFDNVLASHLDPTTRAYWNGRDGHSGRRVDRLAAGFYRQGLLGRFIAAAHVVARLYGKYPRRMMRARTRDEQIALFETELAPLFDRRIIRWLLGHRAALYGLGIPPAQYVALLGDAAHMADVVRERLRKLACNFDLADNYFAWAAFNRGFATDGCGPVPPCLEAQHFKSLKAKVDRVSVELVSITEFLTQQPASSLDRYVLLDAQDWMSHQDLSQLWTEINRTARPGARVIFRTAGEMSILPGRVPAEVLDRWRYAEARSQELGRQDRSAIYGGFHLYVLNDAG
jgi:S-adenosylmethionine-diacylglycerol 3-amino-3-carboxypropyl transferase